MRYALSFSARPLLASCLCRIHALLPFLFEKPAINWWLGCMSTMVTSRHWLSHPELVAQETLPDEWLDSLS